MSGKSIHSGKIHTTEFSKSITMLIYLLNQAVVLIDVENAVAVQEQRENEHILPKVQESFSKATKTLSECIVAMETVNSWYCILFPSQHASFISVVTFMKTTR